jgi:ATP-dependent helicase/nuclease subunit B
MKDKAFLISPKENLLEKVYSFLAPKERDFSHAVVVFPGKRPAHALRKLIAEKINDSFIPPKIFSIDTFVDFLFYEKLKTETNELDLIDAVAILYDLHSRSEHRYAGRSSMNLTSEDHFGTLDSFLPLGIRLFAEFEELLLADLPEMKITEALSSLTFDNRSSLGRLYAPFYKEVRERHYVTRSMRYRNVAEAVSSISWDEYTSLVFAGFFAFTKTERSIIGGMLKNERAISIFQEGPGISETLRQLNLEPPPIVEQPNAPKLFYSRSPDSHGQIFALTGKIRELLESNPSSLRNTVIVAPKADSLFPLFHQTLSLLPNEEYNISMGYPAARTPVYGFLSTVMNLLLSRDGPRYYAPDYLQFTLHPYIKNMRFGRRSDVTRILFNAIEELFLNSRLKTFFTLEELEDNENLFVEISLQLAGIAEETITPQQLQTHLKNIHSSMIRSMSDMPTIGAFAHQLSDLVAYIDEHSTARLHPFFRPFAETLIESLERLAASLVHDQHLTDVSAYVSLVRNLLGSVEVPFIGTPLKGLQVLGFLETRNLSFERVFILDTNDDVLPGSKGTDVLLPPKLRESLGLPTFRDQERLVKYYFSVLLKAAREVHLFFIENGEKEKSRFIEELIWDEQMKKGDRELKENIPTVQYRISLSNKNPEPKMKTKDMVSFLRDFEYTATAVNTYLRCQLQFYYRYVLHLDEREEISGEVENSDIGTFVHRVLAEYFIRFKNQTLSPETLGADALDAIIEKEFQKTFGSNPIGAKHLMKRQIMEHLRSFLEEYQRPVLQKGAVEIIGLEAKLVAEKNGFKFKGFLDRIERRGEKIYILDYKSGSNADSLRINFKNLDPSDRQSWNHYIGSMQLPFYTLLYSESAHESPDNIVPAYLFLGSSEINEGIEKKLFDDDEQSRRNYGMLESILFSIVREITEMSVPFHPTADPERSCPSCPFNVLCGTQWIKRWIRE